jgi:type VI secretion system protein ImpK
MPNRNFESTEFGSGEIGSRRLADLCSDIFFLIFHIRSGKDPGNAESLRKEISLMVEEIDRTGKRLGNSDEDIKATKYALLALIDETILNSNWAYKDQWADKPLQLEYFGEHMAGERFFDLLERVRQKGSRKVDLLEVFGIVLILGFQGKFKLGGREALDKLTHELVDEVTRYRGGTPMLSPNGRIPDEPVQRPPKAIPRWAWISGLSAVALALIVFLILKWILVGSIDEAVKQIFL